jgi:protein-disulfide isomerase
MDRRFIIILLVVIFGLGGLFYFSGDKSISNNNGNSSVSVSNHKKGGNAKNVEVKVYEDFECSACHAFFPVEKQVIDKYINDISFMFRHFVLDYHQNARAAARAAEAAGNQGKFFEMHDKLYENYDMWVGSADPLNIFTKLAKILELDEEKFKADYYSETTNSIINADYKDGSNNGVDGTPTYFIDGKKMSNQDISTVDKFSAEIEKAFN